MTDRLRNELVQFDEIEIVERKRIDAVFQEQKIQLSGCADECLIEVGKILGSSSIIVGSIGKVGIILQLMLEKSMQLLQELKAQLVMIAIPILINF